MDNLVETPYRIIETKEEFLDVVEMCKETRTFCFDFETTGLDWFRDNQKATILSMSFQQGFSYILPLHHFESNFFQHDIKYFLEILQKEIFANIRVNKIAHNLKFDMHWLHKYGVTKYDGRFNCTMLMSHILDENSNHGLKYLAKKYFAKFTGYESEVGGYNWNETPLNLLSQYAAIDTDLTLRLYHLFEGLLITDGIDKNQAYKIKREISAKKGNYRNTEFDYLKNSEYWRVLELKPNRLYDLYRNLVMPSFFALFRAESFGTKIDSKLIEKSIVKAERLKTEKHSQLMNLQDIKRFENKKREKIHNAEIALLEEKIEKILKKYSPGTALELRYREKLRGIKSGDIVIYEGINFNSPKQLQEFLFTDIGLNLKGQLERNGQRILTTKRDYLLELVDKHKFVTLLLAYRSISSMLSTFYRGILNKLDSNNYLHTSFLLHGTVSGRVSSRNPNLQNIPSRIKFNDADSEEVLNLVKKFFVCLNKDYYVVQVDYSQAELRVVANFSGDKKMIDTYKKGEDIHAITASKELGISLKDFYELEKTDIKKHRNAAKGTNFGLVYDMSIQGYMKYAKNNYSVNLDVNEAIKRYETFFTTYSSLKRWHTDFIDFASEYGYVRTLFGRKRRLLNINSKDDNEKNAESRFAINSPIQGSSGEFTLFSAAILRHRLPKDCILFNTVHDSLFFHVPKNKINQYLEIIKVSCEKPPIEEYFDIWTGDVSMKVDIEISDKSWGDMKELENFFK